MKYSKSIILLSIVVLISSVAQGGPFIETKLVPIDAGQIVPNGSAVAINGTTAAVSAFPTNGGAGEVFIFERVGTNWVQTQKLTASDGRSIGFSLEMDDSTLVTGAGSIGDSQPSSVAIFHRTGTTWVQQQIVTGSDTIASDFFGAHVAVNGNTIAVGAPNGARGAVYVFVLMGNTWVQQQKLLPSDPGDPFSNQLGWSVAVSGDTLLAGANLGGSTGEVYFFQRVGNTWQEQQRIDLQEIALFGFSVAIDGDVAVIGAPLTDLRNPLPPNGFPEFWGAAYVYVRSGSSWVESQFLTASDEQNADVFGWSVAIKGSLIAIGSPGDHDVTNAIVQSPGSAYLFEFNGSSWVQQQEFHASFSLVDHLGQEVGVSSSGLIASAPGFFDTAPSRRSAFVFSPVPTNAPIITSATATPSVLFPPNHKLVPVTVSVNATGNPATCRIVSVSSNQPINGTGDGNTSPDWVITGDLTVLLRAERAGNIKTDRVYTITVECTDAFGNSDTTNVFVTVPHDRGK